MQNQYSLTLLASDTTIPAFDCGNADINDFLAEDAKDYLDGLLAVTYLLRCDERIVGYFCLLNDKLAYMPGDDKAAWNRLNRKVANRKRMKSYPAVKIGRLGTSLDFAHQGMATRMIDVIKRMFASGGKTGCRFLTVDAHRDALGFYLKCGFQYFTAADETDDTRLMYFDLKPFKDALSL